MTVSSRRRPKNDGPRLHTCSLHLHEGNDYEYECPALVDEMLLCLCSEGGVSKKHLNAKLEHEEFHMSHTVPYHQPMAQVHTLKAANNIYTITVNSQ